MNCWEFKQCGRARGGAKAQAFGVCPAYPDHGKQCARVAGTLCGGKVQGTFAMKVASCMECDFYKSEHYDKPFLIQLNRLTVRMQGGELPDSWEREKWR